MKCLLYTEEGLLLGWADLEVQETDPANPTSPTVGGPFHPNDFYDLISPIMSRFRWRHDVTVGELNDCAEVEGIDALELWLEFSDAIEEINNLHLNLRNAVTGESIKATAFFMEESDGTYTLYALMESSKALERHFG